ncbi:hypothetical protein HBN50_02880 [Halobacteriovorax sp. GB3]|uniref:hypothetical protein n=1 Tax=Halobacteriovorax sp. GB3 TaxID=2719615 RepID=UPI0023631193|nr:hypothetical protein [Halobacteriovorax sp. GB3]MDD0852019.1 hypothetical protein [Halobacteriovorax sp. GB3]
MGWSRESLRNGLSRILFQLGSIPFQKDLWESKLPGYWSCFDEVLIGLDSCSIPDSLDFFVEEGFLSEIEARKLSELSDLVDAVIEYFGVKSDPPHEDIWNTEIWKQFEKESWKIFEAHFLNDFLVSGEPSSEWYEKYSKKKSL